MSIRTYIDLLNEQASSRQAAINYISRCLRMYNYHMIAAVALQRIGDKEGSDKHWANSTSQFSEAHAQCKEMFSNGTFSDDSDRNIWNTLQREAREAAHSDVQRELQ